MRKPCRLKIAVGRFDQRLRWASSLKSKTTLPRWASSSVARNFFVAATIPTVGAPGVEFVWAKLLSARPAPNNTIKTSATFLFMAKLKRNPSHGSRRTAVHRTSPKQRRALDGQIAAGNRTLVSDVALSSSEWGVSRFALKHETLLEESSLRPVVRQRVSATVRSAWWSRAP